MTVHHLSASDYGVVDRSPTAHLVGSGGESLCGRRVRGPVPTGRDAWRDSAGYHVGYHCIECTATYRRRNGGATPVTFDF